MALRLTTLDGEPVMVELADLAAIHHTSDGTELYLHSREPLIVRESDDELYTLILAEHGPEPPPYMPSNSAVPDD